MDISIDKAAVEAAVTSAIVNSSIGDKIKAAVLELLSRSWDNPIQKAVEKVIAEVALDMIRTGYDAPIREAVRKCMEDETVDELVKRLWERVMKADR